MTTPPAGWLQPLHVGTWEVVPKVFLLLLSAGVGSDEVIIMDATSDTKTGSLKAPRSVERALSNVFSFNLVNFTRPPHLVYGRHGNTISL